MIVAVNKMDDSSVNYSQERFKEIKEEITTYLKSLGYKPEKIPFIPISGWIGKLDKFRISLLSTCKKTYP